MLPQMMPLPWVIVFIMVFLCFFSIFLLFSNFSASTPISSKFVKSPILMYSW